MRRDEGTGGGARGQTQQDQTNTPAFCPVNSGSIDLFVSFPVCCSRIHTSRAVPLRIHTTRSPSPSRVIASPSRFIIAVISPLFHSGGILGL